MYDYKLLEALAMVCREKGFDRASDRLFITQSAVSQRIKSLEEQTGQILITRTTPPVPTNMGIQLIKHYNQVRQLEMDLGNMQNGQNEMDFSSISIALNADSLASWFLDGIKSFLEKEKTLVNLLVDDQDETSELLRNGVVSGCISSSKKSIQGCSVKYLGKMEYSMVCTPRFYKKWFNEGVTLENLNKTPAVLYNSKDTLHFKFLKKYLHLSIGDIPVHYIPSSEKLLTFIEMDLAYGMLFLYQCKSLIEEGKLVELSSERLAVDLYWHHWNINSATIQALTEVIIKRSTDLLRC